jgi:hypothetical protein
MVATKSEINSAEVREVQDAFDRWRSGKKGRERIPAKLWRMAAQLCETYSLHRVARWLHLNYTALKIEALRRTGQRRPKGAAPARPAFIEFAPAEIIPGRSSAEYVLEVPPRRGGALRVLARGVGALEVAALVRALHTGGGR